MASNSYHKRRLQAYRRQQLILSPRTLAIILFLSLVLFLVVLPAAVFVSRAASASAVRNKSPSVVLKASTTGLAMATGQTSDSVSRSSAELVHFSKPRSVARKLKSVEQAEGMGARVRRSIGRPELRQLDPFLMLDYATISPPAGFPDHPHRGFETVTYVLEGAVAHEDFAGHKGIIRAGDLQWMTAGRGIVHSEMPVSKGARALQLWVNLPANQKLIEPDYQELESKDIPEVEKDGVKVRVIAGESLGVKSQVYTRTPTMYLDFTLQPGSVVRQATPAGWNAFSYTLDGETSFGGDAGATTVEAHHTVLFSLGDGLVAANKSDKPSRFLLIAGQPLGEPVAQYGPFVMNTQEELRQAMVDYNSFQGGFERARDWVSSGVSSRG